MAENRRGLGRGLSALLDEVEAPAEPGARPSGLSEIPIEAVRPNPDQPRRHFDEAELEELSRSIRDKGILQPILVRPHGRGEYQIVAGERRWRAAQRAGTRTIPAVIRELSDAEVLEIAIVENVQRADLTAIEEAEGYRMLAERFGRTQAQIAEAVGKSRVHVTNAMRLLQLPASVLEMLRDGRLTAGHARPLIGAPDAERIAEEVVGRGLTVRQAETLARGKPPGNTAPGRARKDADTSALESDLSEVLGLPVDIRDAGGAGEVRIRYASLEQLDEICRRLTRG